MVEGPVEGTMPSIGPVSAVVMAPDGCRAVSASDDQTLRLWDLKSGKEIATFTDEDNMASCALLRKTDGRLLPATPGRVHFLRFVEAGETKSAIGETKIFWKWL